MKGIPLHRPASALVLATWGLLVVGASVRVNGAGLACPDWPLCFGEVIPPLDVQVGFEFGHRVLAGLISLAFVALGVAVHRRRGPIAWWWLGAVVLAVQIVLGGLTVLHLLAEWTVASHLLTGSAFVAVLLVLALALRESEVAVVREPVGVADRAGSALLVALLPVQLALGGLVAGSYAGLACGTWPACNDFGWFPTFSGPIGLQVTHRLVAYALLAAAVGHAFFARGRSARAAWLVVGAVTIQAAIGVANVLLRLPVEVTLLHTAGAGAVTLSVALAAWEAWRAPVYTAATTPTRAVPA